jgi:hypothetical protein
VLGRFFIVHLFKPIFGHIASVDTRVVLDKVFEDWLA